MKHLFLTLLMALCGAATHAQTLADLEKMTQATSLEASLTPTDSLQNLMALCSEAKYHDDQQRKRLLSYPTMAYDISSGISNLAGKSAASMQSDNSTVYYKPLDDLSWAGVPLFLAGILAKTEKEAFRQDYKNSPAKTRLITEFKTSVDNYTQYFPPALALGLKIGGVEGRSDWQRFGVSAAMSYAIMAGLVNTIKYTASEMRPDGSTANSWPSGHTATAFVGATILHKEYGLTRSPWFSVLGYGTATATGIMRVLNNRHWVSDVLSGAGIGIMSGELGYMLSDLIYKGKHLQRGMLTSRPNLWRKHPSFFDISMGIGFGSKDIVFPHNSIFFDLDKDIKLQFRSATAVQAEGAYFFNPYIGVGGRLRVRTSPIKGWNDFMKIAENDVQETMDELKEMESLGELIKIDGKLTDMIEEKEFEIKSDHLTEFAGDVGVYFNFPINDKFAIGTKALIGRSIMQALDINAQYKGHSKGLDFDLSIRDGELQEISNIRFYDKGTTYDEEWDYVTVSGDNSTKWGTGLSLTYSYNGNYAWKVFCDYDYTRKTYTMEYDPYHYEYKACPDLIILYNALGSITEPMVFKTKKNMSQFVLGASFSIQF